MTLQPYWSPNIYAKALHLVDIGLKTTDVLLVILFDICDTEPLPYNAIAKFNIRYCKVNVITNSMC